MAADRLEKTRELLLQAVESLRDSTSSPPPPAPERNSAPPNANQAFGCSEREERSCGQYSTTNCRCDVPAFDLRRSMRRLSKIDGRPSKIDVSPFEDRCHDVSTFGNRCVDFRKSMCRPSEMDVLTFEDR